MTKQLFERIKIVVFIVAAAVLLVPQTVSAAPSSSVKEAQAILAKFNIPRGPVDGYYGPQTARGLCAFRQMLGVSPSRANVSSWLLKYLRSYNKKYSSLSKIPAPKLDGRSTYLLVQEHCQAMFYVEKGRYKRVMAVSTGERGHGTPNGRYNLGFTKRGWSCSTSYPESCRKQSAGRFAGISNYGNMYNMRYFRSGGYYVHGSTSVPPYPASKGCIRVTTGDSDWMYDHVGNYGTTYLAVVGSY